MIQRVHWIAPGVTCMLRFLPMLAHCRTQYVSSPNFGVPYFDRIVTVINIYILNQLFLPTAGFQPFHHFL